jgi:hypothetical protein
MANEEMLTDVGARMLAEAFPIEHRPAASKAAEIVAVGLAPRQWTERFSVSMMGQTVSIPARLHFTSGKLPVSEDDDTWPFVRALQTRSNDGYERQRAARDLLADLHPWGASFIVALLGEYIVEILDDVSEAVNRRPKRPPYRRAKGTPFVEQRDGYNGRTVRAGCGVGRA